MTQHGKTSLPSFVMTKRRQKIVFSGWSIISCERQLVGVYTEGMDRSLSLSSEIIQAF
jgi:hypothetical protein